MITLSVNGKSLEVDAEADTPLLWVLRDVLKLTGTKYGCGKGLCGACTVHLNGQAIRSCSLPVSAATGQKITTIEGLTDEGLIEESGEKSKLAVNVGKAVRAAWSEESVPQCGYCQPGQIMSASALLSQNPQPTDEEINSAMAGNICRCGTYPRIQKAIRRAAEELKS